MTIKQFLEYINVLHENNKKIGFSTRIVVREQNVSSLIYEPKDDTIALELEEEKVVPFEKMPRSEQICTLWNIRLGKERIAQVLGLPFNIVSEIVDRL